MRIPFAVRLCNLQGKVNLMAITSSHYKCIMKKSLCDLWRQAWGRASITPLCRCKTGGNVLLILPSLYPGNWRTAVARRPLMDDRELLEHGDQVLHTIDSQHTSPRLQKPWRDSSSQSAGLLHAWSIMEHTSESFVCMISANHNWKCHFANA